MKGSKGALCNVSSPSCRLRDWLIKLLLAANKLADDNNGDDDDDDDDGSGRGENNDVGGSSKATETPAAALESMLDVASPPLKSAVSVLSSVSLVGSDDTVVVRIFCSPLTFALRAVSV